jgi:hypothetical protein
VHAESAEAHHADVMCDGDTPRGLNFAGNQSPTLEEKMFEMGMECRIKSQEKKGRIYIY